MESTPSLVNWHEYNKLKRPGVNRMQRLLQTVACGADGVQYFQWRKGRGGSEQFHGAVVDHDGHQNPRVQRSDRHQRSPGRPYLGVRAACPKRTRP